MKNGFLFKLRILLKSIEIFRNWYLYPLVYFNLTNKPFVIFETKNGLKMKIRTKSTDLMALTNVWLIQEYFQKKNGIKNDGTILDIGAHIGLFCLYASQYNKSGKIFCFEPIKENHKLLLENIELNSIKNIIPFNLAVSSESEKIKMYLSNDQAGHSIFLKNSKPVKVDSISLKKIFDDNKIDKSSFVKLDCEGAEYDIIKSAPIEYLMKIDKIVMECHFVNSKSQYVKKTVEKLDDSKFEVKLVYTNNDLGLIFASRKTNQNFIHS